MSTKQEKYFAFYDQLPEPYRTQAKENYDDDFSSDIPRRLKQALGAGFEWGGYWNKLDTMILNNEIPIEQPKLTDKAFEKECRKWWRNIYDSVLYNNGANEASRLADIALEEYRKRFGGEG